MTMDPTPQAITTTETYSRDWQGGKSPAIPGIGVNAHDYVALSYDGKGNVTEAKYYVGGPEGLLVSQLMMEYEGDLLKSIRRLNLNVPTDPAFM